MLEVSVMTELELPSLLDIYSDPYIQRISHDHRPAIIVSSPNATYLAAKIDGVIVGAFLAIRENTTDINFHALLTKQAIHKSRELGKLCIDWAFAHNEVLRITGVIMQGLESAKNYALKLGFKLEGVKRDAFLKDGIPKNLYILGITRKEWSES